MLQVRDGMIKYIPEDGSGVHLFVHYHVDKHTNVITLTATGKTVRQAAHPGVDLGTLFVALGSDLKTLPTED